MKVYVITYQEPGEGEPCVLDPSLTLEGALRSINEFEREYFEGSGDLVLTENPAEAGPWWHAWSEESGTGYFVFKCEVRP